MVVCKSKFRVCAGASQWAAGTGAHSRSPATLPLCGRGQQQRGSATPSTPTANHGGRQQTQAPSKHTSGPPAACGWPAMDRRRQPWPAMGSVQPQSLPSPRQKRWSSGHIAWAPSPIRFVSPDAASSLARAALLLARARLPSSLWEWPALLVRRLLQDRGRAHRDSPRPVLPTGGRSARSRRGRDFMADGNLYLSFISLASTDRSQSATPLPHVQAPVGQ